MACCGGKRRKEKTKSIMERRRFESKGFKILRLIKGKLPSDLPNQLLLDYHRKCHMLYTGALQHKPPNKVFINQVVEIHDLYVKEMKRRGMKHNTPLSRV